MAINFPSATSVGETYTDPTSGNTYVCVVVGPPAQWVGSGSSTDLSATFLRKDASNDPVTGQLVITPSTDTTGLVVNQTSGNTTAAMRITNEGSGNSLVIEDSASTDSTPIVADSSGRLLVGSTTAYSDYFGSSSTWTGNFQVSRNINDALAQFSNWSTTSAAGNGGTQLYLSSCKSGTIGTHTGGALANGDQVGTIVFNASDGSNFRTAAWIQAAIDGVTGTADVPGRLVFSTTADGAAAPTERMRIDSSGRLLVGTTSGGTGEIIRASGGSSRFLGGYSTDTFFTSPNILVSNVTSVSYDLTNLPGLATSSYALSVFIIVNYSQTSSVSSSSIIHGRRTPSGSWTFATLSNLGSHTATGSGSGTTVTVTFSAGNQFGNMVVQAMYGTAA